MPGEVAAEADVFVPSLGGADYVVTFWVQRGWGPPENGTHVVTRRGDWVRIDEIEEGRGSIHYLGLVHGVEVILIRNRVGGYSLVGIEARRDPRPRETDYRSFKTGETDVVLGEPCEVWDVYRSRPDELGRGGVTRSGCVTADGIELWRRLVATDGNVLSSAEAARVERRPVDAGEVRPPDDLLSLERWFGGGASARDTVSSGNSDFELVLARDVVPGKPAMTVRHGYPWRYEDRYDEGRPRRLSIRREDRATWLEVYVWAHGAAERLRMSNRPPDVRTPRRDVPVPLPCEPPETVLGEPCIWMNATPDMFDAGRHECRTRDGIPLRIKFWSWGAVDSYSALRLSRRTLEFSEVMPPPELLERGRWRLPE